MHLGKKALALLLTLALLCALLPLAAAPAAAADGPTGNWADDGNRDTAWGDPYDSTDSFTISSERQLAQFAFLVNSGKTFAGKTVTLTADLNLGAHYWTPIGYSLYFIGVFDGQGHSITGMNVSGAYVYAGLFGTVGSFIKKGTVQNLNVAGEVSVTSTGEAYAGGVVGSVFGIVSNCSFAGSVTAASGGSTTGTAGGVVGSAYGTVRSCAHSGSVTVTSGGHAQGGGVVGSAGSYGSVVYCRHSGDVRATGGTQNNNSSACAGGIVGSITVNLLTLSDCIFAGGAFSATGANQLNVYGGIVGYNAYGKVQNSYYVRGSDVNAVGNNNSGTVENMTDLAAAELASPSSFPGWDFNNIWKMTDAGPVPRGITAADPREPASWSQLYDALQLGGCIRLTADVTHDGTTDQDLTIPAGVVVALDLNGHVVDRASTAAAATGSVITLNGALVLTDSGATPRYGYWDGDVYKLTAEQPDTGDYDSFPTGGVLTGGWAYQYGGGVQIDSGAFTMNGGAIAGNLVGTASSSPIDIPGGGVYVFDGSFKMNGGAICGNASVLNNENVSGKGGGVFVTSSGTFTMTGGTIAHNTAGAMGGGVFVDSEANHGTFTMTGGLIYGNTAPTGKNVHCMTGADAPTLVTLTLDANDGSETPRTVEQAIVSGADTFIAPVKFSRTGHSFTGWDTNQTGGGTAYAAGAGITSDQALTLYAQWSANSYTVSFQNEDKTVLQSGTWDYGATPSYSGTTPTKAATAQYTYSFKGWDPAIAAVEGDATYTATYNSTVRQYTVRFVDEDGTELQSGKWDYGATPSYASGTPAKAATAQYSYSFAGWDPAITAVSGDATYTATYNSAVNSYKITWMNGDYVLAEDTAAYGAVPSYTGPTPTRAATAEKTFVFSGWTPEVAAVKGDATYSAVFSDSANSYEITWRDDDGSTIDTALWEYGATPTHAAPAKAATAQYTYTFKGWSPAVVPVTGPAAYTAAYDRTVNSYKITWKNGDYVLGEDTAAYGAVPVYGGAEPTKAEDERYTYAFSGWTPEVKPVTGDAVYSAVFKATEKETPEPPTPPEPTPVYVWAPAAPKETRFDAVDTSKGGSLDNFKRSRVYKSGMFTDVDETAWYFENVKAAVEFALMEGMGDGTFGVGAPLKLSEALAIAARLHNIYYGGSGKFDQSKDKNWYQVYEDYAVKYGIIRKGQYDLTAPATRAQFAEILSAALPDEALEAINHVTALPDVAADDPRLPAILRLYNAGILTGVDARGRFDPDAPIPREQITAMATRVADPALRKAFTPV